jgi:hypothetical protein
MSTRNIKIIMFLGSKVRPVRRAYNLTANIEILEHFQSKALRMIVDAPWYVPNTLIRRDLQIPSVKEEISHYSSRLTAHPNDILLTLP